MDNASIIKGLSKPLTASDVELRVGNVSAKGATLLLYKTARTDIQRLNDVVGVNWKREHYYDSSDLLVCKISIFNGTEWVSREDVGEKSNAHADKGYYSDAMKRAGFSWGIGVELYKAPFIFVKCETIQQGKGYKLTEPWFFNDVVVSQYEMDDNNLQICLTKKQNNTTVYSNFTKQPLQERIANAVKRLQNCHPDNLPVKLQEAITALGDRPDFEQFKIQQND